MRQEAHPRACDHIGVKTQEILLEENQEKLVPPLLCYRHGGAA